MSFNDVLQRVRLGKGQMPSFKESEVSDLDVEHIHAWLVSLAPPPTVAPLSRATLPPPPSFPTGALLETWRFVNEMRIRADFAKDLPERQASDEAGKLKILKDYAGDGMAQGQQVLAFANLALNEVPLERVKAILREIIDNTNAVNALFERARGESSFDRAWPLIAEAVTICRLDALPWATQAVRDAGLVGTVRVRVVNAAGAPISGALVTVLTSHTPMAGLADANGIVTITGVAAVPALQVKAYAARLVYHEVNANLSPGASVDATIALSAVSRSDVAPVVSNAVVNPSSGPGNASVTFRMTVIDPQGRLNLAEDQIFALSPDLGLAYVLSPAGVNQYQAQVALPNLPARRYTWYLFAVDHQCNTSPIISMYYQAE